MAENDGISLMGRIASYGVTCLATGSSRPSVLPWKDC
jgi:hypothetical protein